MRDKLIELLKMKYDHYCDQCGVNKDTHYLENLADYLIAHGVTVQRWIPVSERLPEEAGEYNVVLERAEKETSLWYSQYHNGWYDFNDDYYAEPYNDVAYWMPLPKRPREGE